jgi:hypothetical protein
MASVAEWGRFSVLTRAERNLLRLANFKGNGGEASSLMGAVAEIAVCRPATGTPKILAGFQRHQVGLAINNVGLGHRDTSRRNGSAACTVPVARTILIGVRLFLEVRTKKCCSYFFDT